MTVHCFIYIFLQEYILYKQFLEKLTPNDWKEEKMNQRKERQRLKKEAMVGAIICTHLKGDAAVLIF